MSKVRIAAAVVDTERLTLYRENGTTITIPQGDPRLKPIIDEITPTISMGLVAEVDISEPNPYKEYEQAAQKTGGFTKLFRVAKSFVKHLTGGNVQSDGTPEVVAPQTIGTFPMVQSTQSERQQAEAKIQKTNDAIAQIIKHAEPVSSDNYVEAMKTEEDTVIAVVTNNSGEQKIIPGVENLKDQFGHAAKLGSTIGVENFLKRLGDVIDKRGHSVADLLKFMEKGDLPIADDGSIVAYKVLQTRGSHKDEFVDCHTGQVIQKVGSYVFMNEKLVDHDRRRDCSNGLHIARRGYLRSFGGNIIVICKIAPEEVIAVPEYNPNKVRVSGYHILGKIPAEEHQNLRDNKAMTENTEAGKLLTSALRGTHIGKIETVEIGGSLGANLKITPLVKAEADANKMRKDAEQAQKVSEPSKAIEPPKEREQVAHVDVNEVVKTTTSTKAAVPESRNDKAHKLFNEKKWDLLNNLKKASKLSWTKLGFDPKELVIITDAIAAMNVIDKGKSISGSEMLKAVAKVEKTKVTKPKAEPKKKEAVKKAASAPLVQAAKEAEKLNKPIKVKSAPKPKKEETMPEPTGTRAEVARVLFDRAIKDKSQWGVLWQHKQKAKKSWEQLGFTKKEAERIQVNKPDWV